MAKIGEYKSKVIQIKELGNNTRNFFLESPKDFSFVPGQFISVLIPYKAGIVKRSYSLCSTGIEDGTISLCINKLKNGMGTSYLFSINEGDYLSFVGPMGAFKLRDKSLQRDILFVSTGTGIAPFTGMIPYALEHNNNEITLFAGYGSENVVLYDKLFRNLLQKFKNFRYAPIISRPENLNYSGEKGHVQDLIDKYLSRGFEGDVYICGRSDMVKDVCSFLENRGINKDRIYFEKY